MVPMDPSLALFDCHFRYVCARACPALLLMLARRLKVYYRQNCMVLALLATEQARLYSVHLMPACPRHGHLLRGSGPGSALTMGRHV